MTQKKKIKPNPIVVAVTSDQHAGSTIGLCPPRFTLDDGGDYVSSTAQRWLWRNWLHFWAKVKITAEKHEAKIVSVCNGDIVDGNHHRTTQSITGNETLQLRLALDVLKPMYKLADELFVIRGTEVHVGIAGRLEEKIAADLSITTWDGKRASWDHLLLDINGKLFDIAHHGKLGRLPWTVPNACFSIGSQVIVRYHETGDRVPHFVLRAHLHQYADTGTNYNTIRVISMPAWQLPSGYIHRIQPGALADIGGLIFVCYPGGDYALDVVRYRPKRRKPLRVLG